MSSVCPKCGGRLKHINDLLASFDCEDCHQRMDKRDYIEWALKNWDVDIDLLYGIVYEAVNRE